MLLLIYICCGLIVMVLSVGILALLMQVENWQRDLTTNYAVTSADAADARLRPIDSPLAPAELAAQTVAAASRLPGWRLLEQSAAAGRIDLHFVRTTAVMRFQDDIRVHVVPREVGSHLTAESRSRIGKGDFGQNPRNLREMLDQLRPASDK
jgi:uncharacterized protein (DUF1499 family)